MSLLNVQDSSIVKNTATNKAGQFSLNNVSNGKYFLLITGIGFQKKWTNTINISEDKKEIVLPAIALKSIAQQMQEVNVIAKKPFIENKIDKTVVNVDASPTSSGLTALEVLEKTPGVTVDNDGNISIKGKTGVMILVDGKSTFLSGQDLTNYLKNLSANQLDQIEVMTQPSAKYDASGNSGIINFKTKKNKSAGFNGSINATAIFANYFKNTYSSNINYKQNKTNVFANVGYSNWQGFNDIRIQRSFRLNDKTQSNRYYEQSTFGKFSSYPANLKIGLDYSVSKKITIGVAANGTYGVSNFRADGINNIFDSSHNLAGYNRSISQTRDPIRQGGLNANFKYTSGKGAEITADADFIHYQPTSNQFSNNYLYNANNSLTEDPYLLNGTLPTIIDIQSFKSDFSKTLKYKIKFESGIKSSIVNTDNDAQYTFYDASQQTWQKDQGRSNHFIYRENINAAYINLQKDFKKWGVQLGLRAEQTISNGHQDINNSDFKLNYTKLFPTTYISYKENENNMFALSYGRRIERPGYHDLNPFQYLLDRYTYQQGNPLLQPQFSHNVELSYNYKGALNIAANYSTTDGIINDILKAEKSGSNYITYVTKENIASSQNVGLSISFNKSIKKWWTTNVYFHAYNNTYKGMVDNQPIHVSFASFDANMSNQFILGKGWTSEVTGFFNYKNLVSSVILARPMGMFSLGVGKQILNKKGTIKFNLRDPFWLMHFDGYTAMNTYTSAVQSKWDNRRAIFAFTYRFGKANGQQQKRRSSADEEQNRVGGNNNNN
ncbi:MAG: outer membrane beta-barrel family protein [Ginsengibacter sp.]